MADNPKLVTTPTTVKPPWWHQTGLLRGRTQLDSYPPYPATNSEHYCGDIDELLKDMDAVIFSIDFETLCLEKAFGGYRSQPIIEIGISVLDLRNIAKCNTSHATPASAPSAATGASVPGFFPGPSAATAATGASVPGFFPGPTAPVACPSNPGDRGLFWRQHISSDHVIVDEYNDHYAGNCAHQISWKHTTNAYGFAFKASKFIKEADVAKYIQRR
ncbi:hypothetical protein QIS74_01944 [Colletotrichum tabaci]|uniref:Uncharacterized protein n=1 Tax=Colletotrichum tabaci TaxID=1209068 RepID=A0AAV9TQL0_9PEZI